MYVEKSAWKAQVERTGLKQQQALNGWLGLYRKIGKGTGKLVGKFKDEARRVLLECHQAVPVWIMPLSRALESFELGTITFDVSSSTRRASATSSASRRSAWPRR